MTRDVQQNFEILEHTADVGFRARGATAAELFQHAADAFLFIACDRAEARERETLPVVVDGDDLPSLLVNFLEEILYLFDAGRFATVRVSVDEITCSMVRARLHGEPRDPARHPWKLIVKAVTYHGLEVGEHAGRWEARVFMDV
jgi:SHS2 domain-containing protein